jgi:long-chain acyl-CoA synthetase
METDVPPAAQEAEKVWLKSYPKGIPAEIDVNEFSSVVEIVEQSISRFRQLPAFANMGSELSYTELDKQTLNFAAFLQQQIGLNKGERVAIMMPNLLQYPIALFGILRAGLTVTNINPLYTPRELKHQLADSGATAIIILENFCHSLATALPDTQVKYVITTRIGDFILFPKSALVNFVVKHVKHMVPSYHLPDTIDFKKALKCGAQLAFKPPAINRKDIAFLQYTAGTTGVAKGVILTHGNIVANLQQASAWVAPYTEEGKEIIITPLPLYHIFSLTANCLLYMKIGGLIYLITNPRDFKGFVNELKHVRFTAITGVNTLFNALLNTPGISDVDFSSLKIALGGGMPVQRTVAQRWKKLTGTTLIEAYGLTETSPGACINPIDLEEYNGSVGLPLPSTECCIQNEDGEALPNGDMGEICVRGPQVMQGYLNRPEQTAKVLTADGWFHTGDIGVMDKKGFISILERKDDMINVSGFNVYPSEIEEVVTELPGVLEVAVVGVPDKKSGQAIKLFVVTKEPALTEETLQEFCRQRLTGYKVPHYIEFRDELPKSHIGKILRRVLREET